MSVIVDGITIGEGADLELPVVIQAKAIVWLMIIGNLQLALRHPMNKGISASTAKKFGQELLRKLRADNLITEECALAAFQDFYGNNSEAVQ